jgi:MoaA/NifB/PqqE/SkfB family radical SAM enzyme
MKKVRTATYNYNFDEKTGYFERWGKSVEDDPQYSPIGPEIADIAVSSICHQNCQHCYKSNTSEGKNMSFETFKGIVDKIPTLTQIAFGIGSLDACPDLFKMFVYCRSKNIVPNVTINGSRMTDELFEKLASLCGAVSISNYAKDTCYGAVEKLTSLGLKQTNIHQLLCEENFGQILELLNDIQLDKRLSNLNAVVFLSLKKKGRGEGYHKLSDDKFNYIINYCLSNNLRFGLDSCGSAKFLKAIEDHKDYESISQCVEPCESSIFSYFINEDGVGYPCSFSEGIVEGIDVTKSLDFLQDVWYNSATIDWRKKLLDGCRNCPIYDV